MQQIKHQILRTLRDAVGHPLGQDVLILQVRDRIRPFPKDEAIMSAIQDLEAVNFIMQRANELDAENPVWFLDEKGQVYCARQRL